MKRIVATSVFILLTGGVAFGDATEFYEQSSDIAAQSCASVPTGTISPFAGTTAPVGYLFVDGSAINRTTYANLFAVIGTIYGSGNGSTTFNLPDMRGHMLSGLSTAGGTPTAGTLAPGGSAVGDIVATASTCPTGTIAADGSSYSTSTYPALFTAIGYTHGGSGSSFNVPDYRGRFLRGVDGSAGNDPDKTSRSAMNAGGNTGNNVGSVQGDALASHAHSIAYGIGAGGADTGVYSRTATVSSGSTNLGSTGGNETRPKNAYVNFCVRTVATSVPTVVVNYIIKY